MKLPTFIEANKRLSSEHVSVVDVFCGAGGLSLGLKQAGLPIAAGIDLDPDCRFPFEHNIGAPFHELNVADLQPEEVQAMFGKTKIRVLAGCAPCQPFSGYTTKRHGGDERWRLLLDFLRIVRGVRPDVVTMENVSRLTLLPIWTSFVSSLEEAGYSVAWKVVDAADYGLPQNRRRVVLLASLLGPIAFPDPLHRKGSTVWQAISSLPKLPAGGGSAGDPLHVSRGLTDINLFRIRSSMPAGTWKSWPNELRADCHRVGSGRTYPSVYGRMSWDRPSPTITTQFYGFGNGRFGHPEQDRALTLREGAILQSFPTKFKFSKPGEKISFNRVGRLIGNAVPPLLAKAIGRSMIEHLHGL